MCRPAAYTTAVFQVMRALVEFAQGNEGNKLAIATPSLSATINDLFRQRCAFAFPMSVMHFFLVPGERSDTSAAK